MKSVYVRKLPKSVIVDIIERYFHCHFRFLLPIQVLYSITYDVYVIICWGQNVLTQKTEILIFTTLIFSKSKSYIYFLTSLPRILIPDKGQDIW